MCREFVLLTPVIITVRQLMPDDGAYSSKVQGPGRRMGTWEMTEIQTLSAF